MFHRIALSTSESIQVLSHMHRRVPQVAAGENPLEIVTDGHKKEYVLRTARSHTNAGVVHNEASAHAYNLCS